MRSRPYLTDVLLVSYTLYSEVPQQIREVLVVLVDDIRQPLPLLPPGIPERVVRQTVPGVVAPLLDGQARTDPHGGIVLQECADLLVSRLDVVVGVRLVVQAVLAR